MTSSAFEFLEYASSEPLVLGHGEVHIWRGALDLPAAHLSRLKQTLALEERTRASRFRSSTDRSRFIAGRGTLRTILGRYVNRDPHSLRFAYNGYGKPVLIEEAENDSLQFNVTHSQNLALYAVTRQGEIGIDVEQISAEARDYENLARSFFSAAEAAELLAVPAEQRQTAFLNGWTRKEAYIKARGLGLSLDLRQFDVSLTPGVPAALLANREIGQEQTLWSLYEFAPGPGFIAALAVQGDFEVLRCWGWPA